MMSQSQSKKANRPEHCEECPSLGKGIFCELERLCLNELSGHKVNNVFKKGQTLFVEGNPPFGVFCVSEGNIKVSKMSADGKESIVRIASQGDIIGHRSIFTDQYYSASATAMEDSAVCFVDKKYIIKLVREQPTVACHLISLLGRDLGAAENRIASFAKKNVRERVAEFLLLLKESHGTKDEDGRFRLVLKLSREEMASIVGTATETLIRFISELKDEGIIDQDGKSIVICDEERLVEFANIGY
ncbi:MAG: Crp/Fnr family transcriptional regulator [Bdellovibrionota bacterium]